MLRAWRAPPLARARVGAARGWARSAASEAAAESREDSRYRDTVLLPRSRFPAQLPGRLQPEKELETQQVRPGPGRFPRVRVPGGARGRSGQWECRVRFVFGPAALGELLTSLGSLLARPFGLLRNL